ncbi:MAG: recombinase family protein, partial [Dehalococcoidia bacterium]
AEPDAPRSGPNSLEHLSRSFDTYCTSKRHTPMGVFAEDPREPDSPRYAEMLEHIRKSKVGFLVVVPNAQHLGASLEDQVGRVLELDAMSCQVICDDLDVPDPLQSALKAAEGLASSAARRERIREGMKAKAARGLGLGKPPYGYRIGHDGVLRPVDAEADVVRSIFRLYLDQDGGVRAIARDLNDRGLRTRRGQRWSMVTVRDILRNSAYIGTYRRFGLRIPGSYEPIVSDVEYRRVQERMQGRSPVRRHPRGEPFLLSGILYCGHCGQRMMGVTRRQTWRRKDGERARGEYRYYQCQSRINRSQCQYHTTRAAELEEAVLEKVKAFTPDLFNASANGLGNGKEGMALDRSQVESRLKTLSKRFSDSVQRAASGAMSLQQLRTAVSEADTARRSIQDRLALIDGGEEHLRGLMEAQREKLHAAWGDMDIAERQEALRTLVSRVTVKDSEVEVLPR